VILRDYRIAYKVFPTRVIIIAAWHGAMDLSVHLDS
jgi:plasmid stabilization system protein ParE